MIRVAGAAIIRAGRVLLAQRPADHHLALKWEFPGGKVEPGETDEQALERELNEELGIHASIGPPLCTSRDLTGPVAVELVVHTATLISGALRPREHRDIRWVPASELLSFDLAPADVPAATRLQVLAGAGLL